MSRTRVYLPSTLTRLRDAARSGTVGAPPVLGHAVTEALRAEDEQGDDEVGEYAAMTAAAQDSLGLLAADDPPRRVVIVVDSEAVVPVETGGVTTLVELREAVPAGTIAAVHVDDVEAEPAVVAACASWADAAAGHEDAAVVVERCLEHELGWYATQEIGDLLET